MDRREVLKFGAGLSAALMLARQVLTPASALGGEAGTAAELSPNDWSQFSEDMLIEKARRLSQAPYSPPEDTIPPSYKALDYDQFRAIRFKKNLALWRSETLGFIGEFFSAGYIYRVPIQIHVIDGDRAGDLQYNPGLFTYGPKVPPPPENTKPGFSGFRIHAAINRADVLDEFVVFQGASYFRSKAIGQDYGISARGLAINTAQPPVDEFPLFREFWIKKPAPGASSLTLYALLDSVSVSGMYKFVISNVHNTVMEIDCTLFPRKTMTTTGIAPLTSMFYFAPSNRIRGDDVRPQIHDSDGLSIWNGKDEHIWRPLVNANQIQFSGFTDDGLKGFGLLQRERRADRYQDFDANYELRPSVWVEPKENWGEGTVDLIELPTHNEYLDNIVAYWRPKDPLEAGRTYRFQYRLTWCYDPPVTRNFAFVSQTLVGASTQHAGMRLFYIDFSGTEGLNLCDDMNEVCSDKLRNVQLTASAGSIVNAVIRQNKIAGGHRVGFEYEPGPGVTQADIRCALISEGKPVSEVWIYRWTT
jgi:glucans biosynthesis protein